VRLTTLRPRLATIATQRIPTLTTQEAGARPAGRSWQKTRERIQARDGSLCADCGLLWRANLDHVDHEIPRWKGGSDEDGNLKLRCWKCHKAKSDREAAERASLGASARS
jgi:5-methylcytosine-specific restriction protein A